MPEGLEMKGGGSENEVPGERKEGEMLEKVLRREWGKGPIGSDQVGKGPTTFEGKDETAVQ